MRRFESYTLRCASSLAGSKRQIVALKITGSNPVIIFMQKKEDRLTRPCFVLCTVWELAIYIENMQYIYILESAQKRLPEDSLFFVC